LRFPFSSYIRRKVLVPEGEILRVNPLASLMVYVLSFGFRLEIYLSEKFLAIVPSAH
jgi:hypothetical protein